MQTHDTGNARGRVLLRSPEKPYSFLVRMTMGHSIEARTRTASENCGFVSMMWCMSTKEEIQPN